MIEDVERARIASMKVSAIHMVARRVLLMPLNALDTEGLLVVWEALHKLLLRSLKILAAQNIAFRSS